MEKVTITIEWVHSGHQLRSYGPHVREAVIRAESNDKHPFYASEDYALRVAKGMMAAWCEGKGGDHSQDTANDHYRPHLQNVAPTGDGGWRVRIETPFTD